MEVSVILNDIRSAHNVGSIFRTADGAGVSRIYLCGYTPAPVDRFDRPVKEIAKVALGAERTVPYEVREITELISELKSKGTQVVALEQSPNALSYTNLVPTGDIALVLGSEVPGIPEEILNLCGAVIEIPMRGSKESLNVAVAAGIALYSLIGR